MPRRPLALNLSVEEINELESIISQEGSDHRIVLRCRIILLTEEGVPLQEIADRLGLSKVTVNTCRQNFLANGIQGLKTRKRPGRPSKLAKEILSNHFPDSADNVFLSLKKAFHIKAKTDHLAGIINMVGGLMTCNLIISSL